VRLRQLRLENLRAFPRLELDLGSGWNVFVGANGAGKTTVLEAAYLLSHARSFRSGPRDALIRRSTAGYSVFGAVEPEAGGTIGVGLSRVGGALEARIAGTAVPLAELLRRVAVACFEPGSHELISGPAEERRSFLDWGVFHVEHEFLRVWRAFQRALKQRNALLRSGGGGAALDPWDQELVRSGAELSAMRARYVDGLAPIARAFLAELLPELGDARLALEGGWGDEAVAIAELAASRDEDMRRGFTTRGPHRADWAISFDNAPRREHLSRGQEKLCALGCILGQARAYADRHREWPIVCIDDLASELDTPHQEKLVRALASTDAQILVTGTREPDALRGVSVAARRFHVEPGQVTQLL
jgi:DNA replication and repair protein RecF